jgi:hypothetical protein
MVYAHQVTRVTLSGTMFSASEEWSTGFFMGHEGSDATKIEQAGADLIRDAWVTFFSHMNSYINTTYKFTQVKTALIDANGFTVDGSQVYSYPTGTVSGNTGTNTLPPQCSLVATLLSDRPRGRASKGRMYLPGISAGIQSASGKLFATDVDSIATNLKTFFDALTGAIDIPDQLILAAKGVGVTPALTAQNDYVETIRVGDVVDTQRRRRNGLVETYTSKVLL